MSGTYCSIHPLLVELRDLAYRLIGGRVYKRCGSHVRPVLVAYGVWRLVLWLIL
jgi:hypothetical protein